ncbi:ABC transporter ATP-binding protein [Paenibacillus sp. J5C_2022]|uniref:ABC transporter ATP-binding protein n=1 Tax=Paenibacillus sp. J5C2022 TaxID=2977129 RepID=UPI0021D00459|nr:ABC transporter ATP-binding protein [Paenibacillus sp. J5C2022]MCU6709189.1 ABC transporter ATP-binding protein [Paenibacillus sp. J5C2022]
MEPIIVSMREVTKRIGKRTIIDRLSLDLRPGEVFGFLGPNGSGKTTTIRMMVGLMSLNAGEITINGYNIEKEYEKAISYVGAIVENPEMYKYLTGYQNLLHYGRMMPGVTEQRIQEAIEVVGMGNRIHDKVRTYSLGMRQRLGLAQAILHRPKLLILDEPTNGLDPAGIRELRDYLRKLAKDENIAVFVSSHLLSEMELMCDRVAIIQNGKLIDERIIGEHRESASVSRILYEVDQADKALEILLTQGQAAEGVGNGLIALEAERERAAELNALLVAAGIKVYGIRKDSKSLEDQFLEVTGGESIG